MFKNALSSLENMKTTQFLTFFELLIRILKMKMLKSYSNHLAMFSEFIAQMQFCIDLRMFSLIRGL